MMWMFTQLLFLAIFISVGQGSFLETSASIGGSRIPQCVVSNDLLSVQVRSRLECANLCQTLSPTKCSGFNFNDPSTCDLFPMIPTDAVYKFIAGCVNYQWTALANEAMTYGSNLNRSCLDLQKTYADLPSGLYNIVTSANKIIQVYCEMSLNGGGYTFFTDAVFGLDLAYDEVQDMFHDRTSFLFRGLDGSGIQYHSVLTQLSQYSSIALKLGVNENNFYLTPHNNFPQFIGNRFLYFGFLPISSANNFNQQGVNVNGIDVTFDNCDTIPNSYLALFPFSDTPNPAAYGAEFQFTSTFLSYLQVDSTESYMPSSYFYFMEMHFGGCGVYTQTDGRPGLNVGDATLVGVNIGFK